MKIVSSNVEYYKDSTVKLYYVSEYIEGCTLEKYVDEHDLSFKEVKEFFEDFIEADETGISNV